MKKNDRILNCGGVEAEPRRLRFQFQCPNQWEILTTTPEASVRYCSGCQRKVYYCSNATSAAEHALAGHCITVPARITVEIGGQLARDITGTVDAHDLWAQSIFGNETE